MRPRTFLPAIVALALTLSACAQGGHGPHGGAHHGHAHGGYAGLQKRTIKALSDEQVASYATLRGY